MAKKPSKDTGSDKPSDDEVMSLFENNLMSYFGDDEEDVEIIARLRELFPDYPSVQYNFRRGLEIAMELSNHDCVRIVEGFANRRAETGEVARAWLANLSKELFGPKSGEKI